MPYCRTVAGVSFFLRVMTPCPSSSVRGRPFFYPRSSGSTGMNDFLFPLRQSPSSFKVDVGFPRGREGELAADNAESPSPSLLFEILIPSLTLGHGLTLL